MNEETRKVSKESVVQLILKQVILIGFVAFFLAFFGYLLHSIVTQGWILDKIQQHFVATIIMTFSALAALFIVLLLQYSTGTIEFEAIGFKFRGASGPVVLWVLCFLAMVGATKVLI